MVTSARISPMLRRLVAAHEAGHAAVSLALGVGHQEGVSISLDGGIFGEHVVADQIDLAALPRPMALLNGIRSAMVSLAGPIAQANAEGVEFDLSDFIDGASEPGSDAAQSVHAVEVVARHLRIGLGGVLLVEDVAEATAVMLTRPDVIALTEAITAALIRRGRVGGDGLDLLVDRNPVASELIRVPKELVDRWSRISADCNVA